MPLVTAMNWQFTEWYDLLGALDLWVLFVDMGFLYLFRRDSPYDVAVFHPKHKGSTLASLPEGRWVSVIFFSLCFKIQFEMIFACYLLCDIFYYKICEILCRLSLVDRCVNTVVMFKDY